MNSRARSNSLVACHGAVSLAIPNVLLLFVPVQDQPFRGMVRHGR